MAELVRVQSSEGISHVINLDHVVYIQDMGPNNNECSIVMTTGYTIKAPMSASKIAELGRLEG